VVKPSKDAGIDRFIEDSLPSPWTKSFAGC